MILLIDGGSTKSDCAIVENGKIIARFLTGGTNPFFQTPAEIDAIVSQNIVPHTQDKRIRCVYFYGAGCISPEKNKIIHAAIAKHINVEIEVESDLLGAARALCKQAAGIACILGTGSNSCFYDGQQITEHISPLGYILGDEGSGAVLGKLLVGACLKNQLSITLKEAFLSQFELSPLEILDKVYKQSFPNRFLASLSPFLLQNIGDKQVYKLIVEAFEAFFLRNVMQYDYQNCEVHLVGSIAHFYEKIIRSVAASLNIQIGLIRRSPMEGLVEYHTKQR